MLVEEGIRWAFVQVSICWFLSSFSRTCLFICCFRVAEQIRTSFYRLSGVIENILGVSGAALIFTAVNSHKGLGNRLSGRFRDWYWLTRRLWQEFFGGEDFIDCQGCSLEGIGGICHFSVMFDLLFRLVVRDSSVFFDDSFQVGGRGAPGAAVDGFHIIA